jgi:hypothetical protein
MKIKLLQLSFVLLLLSCSSEKKEAKCSTETIAQLQSEIQFLYMEWKSTLNYMDKEVVGKAYDKMDSTLTNIPSCYAQFENFLLYADSVSSIYTKDKILQYQLNIANDLIQQLDTLIAIPIN